MFIAELDPKSVEAIQELRRRNQQALKALSTDGDTAVVRMLAFVVERYAQAWEDEAPVLTGTLAASTEGQVHRSSGEGQVFINQQRKNPVFGGKPADYGPIVHHRNPWVSQVFMTETPKIIKDSADLIWEAMDEIYKQ